MKEDPQKQPLEHMLEKHEAATSSWRPFYRLREPSSKALSPLPEQITLSRIDEAMFGDTSLVNRHLRFGEIYRMPLMVRWPMARACIDIHNRRGVINEKEGSRKRLKHGKEHLTRCRG